MLLLEEAGWRPEKDGVRARGGEKLRVILAGVGAGVGPERDLVVSGLRRGGFGVEISSDDPAGFLDRLRRSAIHAAVIDLRARVDDDLAPLFATGGARNFGGFSSPAIDAVLAGLARVWEPVGRRGLATQLGVLLTAEMPLIPLVAPEPRGLAARRVGGLAVRDGWFRLRDLKLGE
jgi:hypothetical protein